jgi:hypothetical protein
MGSRLFHQEVKEISHDYAEKFLDRTGDERRAELKEKEVNKPIKRSGVTFFHINPVVALNSSFEIIKRLTIEGSTINQCHPLDHTSDDI